MALLIWYKQNITHALCYSIEVAQLEKKIILSTFGHAIVSLMQKKTKRFNKFQLLRVSMSASNYLVDYYLNK